ncbi:hypothetical protein MKZ38_009912 [Zalerion maritima]|uniref:Uncharacterized protein n=1 Tax=Zalerion maritima TaxID=339359 RepID=A0AAD5RSZ3_9PEZI|nr:hypothetical protein MKZ38_009912 [Zalerion maritima]
MAPKIWQGVTASPNIIPLLPTPGFIYPRKNYPQRSHNGFLSSEDRVIEVYQALQPALAHSSTQGIDHALALLFQTVPEALKETGGRDLHKVYNICCQKHQWSREFSADLAAELMDALVGARSVYIKVSRLKQVPESELREASSTLLAKAIDALSGEKVHEKPDDTWQDADPRLVLKTVKQLSTAAEAEWPDTDPEDEQWQDVQESQGSSQEGPWNPWQPRTGTPGTARKSAYVGWGHKTLDRDNAQYPEQYDSEVDSTYQPTSGLRLKKQASPRKAKKQNNRATARPSPRPDGDMEQDEHGDMDVDGTDSDDTASDPSWGERKRTNGRSQGRRNPTRATVTLDVTTRNRRHSSQSQETSGGLISIVPNVQTRRQHQMLREILDDGEEIDSIDGNHYSTEVENVNRNRRKHKLVRRKQRTANANVSEAGSNEEDENPNSENEVEESGSDATIRPNEESVDTLSQTESGNSNQEQDQSSQTLQPAAPPAGESQDGRYNLRRRTIPPSNSVATRTRARQVPTTRAGAKRSRDASESTDPPRNQGPILPTLHVASLRKRKLETPMVTNGNLPQEHINATSVVPSRHPTVQGRGSGPMNQYAEGRLVASLEPSDHENSQPTFRHSISLNHTTQGPRAPASSVVEQFSPPEGQEQGHRSMPYGGRDQKGKAQVSSFPQLSLIPAYLVHAAVTYAGPQHEPTQTSAHSRPGPANHATRLERSYLAPRYDVLSRLPPSHEPFRYNSPLPHGMGWEAGVHPKSLSQEMRGGLRRGRATHHQIEEYDSPEVPSLGLTDPRRYQIVPQNEDPRTASGFQHEYSQWHHAYHRRPRGPSPHLASRPDIPQPLSWMPNMPRMNARFQPYECPHGDFADFLGGRQDMFPRTTVQAAKYSVGNRYDQAFLPAPNRPPGIYQGPGPIVRTSSPFIGEMDTAQGWGVSSPRGPQPWTIAASSGHQDVRSRSLQHSEMASSPPAFPSQAYSPEPSTLNNYQHSGDWNSPRLRNQHMDEQQHGKVQRLPHIGQSHVLAHESQAPRMVSEFSSHAISFNETTPPPETRKEQQAERVESESKPESASSPQGYDDSSDYHDSYSNAGDGSGSDAEGRPGHMTGRGTYWRTPTAPFRGLQLSSNESSTVVTGPKPQEWSPEEAMRFRKNERRNRNGQSG